MELMDGTPYTELILGLPEIELPVPGAQGWLLQGEERQMAFFDLPEGGRIPLHSHGEQWGLVVRGEMELTIAGETRRLGPGDWYRIPADVEHGAHFLTRIQVIDLFADTDRYSLKEAAGE
jgi:quercetin dioxygenase-like cupin family protein